MFNKELGIIGVGKIGSALLKRFLCSKTIGFKDIIIYDIDSERLNTISDEYNVSVAESAVDLVRNSKYILIAVIPQVINILLNEIKNKLSLGQIIISIVAGVSISHIKSIIKKPVSIVRIMTNSPALIGEAATVISPNQDITAAELKFTRKLFESVGMVVELEEHHLDAVTGLSGSGPAYIFIIIEALADGGVKMGLSREISIKLAAQTVLGSAKLLLNTNKHPGELKDMVATPAGTTITAIHEIESAKLRATLIRAVEAATLKSKSLNSSSIK